MIHRFYDSIASTIMYFRLDVDLRNFHYDACRAFRIAVGHEQIFSPFGTSSEQILNDHWYRKILVT